MGAFFYYWNLFAVATFINGNEYDDHFLMNNKYVELLP